MKRILSAVKNALFPPKCAFCGQPCGASRYCGKCALVLLEAADREQKEQKLNFVDGFIAPFVYTGGVRRAIVDLKKNRIRDNYLPLARFMCDALERSGFAGADLVTCIPIGKSSLYEREFNQSQLLAAYIARHFGIPFAETMSCREDGLHQKELSAAERAVHIAGRFSVLGKAGLIGKHVLLIDDVMTTGATVNEASRILKEAGAFRVTVCCAAATRLHGSESGTD